MSEQKILYVEIDEEKVRRFVEEKKKEIEQAIKHAEMSSWLLGKLISSATVNWSRHEISYLYTLMEKSFGLSRRYIAMCKHFAEKFPNLPYLLEEYKLPYSFWMRVANYNISADEIILWVGANKDYLEGLRYSDLIKEFKNAFGYRIRSRNLWCEICEARLEEDEKDKSWRFIPVCDKCLNEVKKKQLELMKVVDEYIEMSKEKDLKIRNLLKLMSYQDKAIQDIKRRILSYLLKIRNRKLTKSDKEFLSSLGISSKDLTQVSSGSFTTN